MNRRKIELYLADGTFSGIVGAKIDGCLGRMTKIDRSQADNHYDGRIEIEPELKKLQRPGIYLLMGQTADGTSSVYIGESVNVYERLNQHISAYKAGKNSFAWTTAYAFTRKGLDLTKLLYLEYQFCQLIRDSERYKCLTKNVTMPEIDEYDEPKLLDDIEDIELLLKAVGCDVLDDLSSLTIQDVMLYYKDQNGTDAKACYHDGKFVIKEGSKISTLVSESIPEDYLEIRNRLQHPKNKTIVDGVFTKDCEFETITPATAVVCGRMIRAKNAWKTAEGVTVEQSKRLHVKKKSR